MQIEPNQHVPIRQGAQKVSSKPGLEGVIAGETAISKVDGAGGRLIIRGLPIEEFAIAREYEDALSIVIWDKPELSSEQRELLVQERKLDHRTDTLLRYAARDRTKPMDALRMGLASLEGTGDLERDALRAIAKAASCVAHFQAYREEREVDPHFLELPSLAEFFLAASHGRAPNRSQVHALNIYWNTVVDHGFNNSTFTARCVISTGSDLISAITAASCSLAGPLHGGAPGPALAMIERAHESGDPKAVVEEILDSGGRLMGFGHRQYKVRDPRAEVLSEATKNLSLDPAAKELYDSARLLEQTAVRILAERKPGRDLNANVEFYTSLLLKQLGFEGDGFTPVFATGRVAGWIGHAFEQIAANKLIRPSCVYVGR